MSEGQLKITENVYELLVQAKRERNEALAALEWTERERDTAQEARRYLRGERDRAEARAQKAEAELQRVVDSYASWQVTWRHDEKELKARAQKAEAALREIAEAYDADFEAGEIARRALVDEPPTEQIPGAGQDGC